VRRLVGGEVRQCRNLPPWEPKVAPCLGIYSDPRGVGVSYERGTPVGEAVPEPAAAAMGEEGGGGGVGEGGGKGGPAAPLPGQAEEGGRDGGDKVRSSVIPEFLLLLCYSRCGAKKALAPRLE